MTHRHATAPQARATLAAIEHPGVLVVKDARLLGAQALLSAVEKQAKALSLSTLKPAAVSTALITAEAAEQAVISATESALEQLAAGEKQFAALD